MVDIETDCCAIRESFSERGCWVTQRGCGSHKEGVGLTKRMSVTQRGCGSYKESVVLTKRLWVTQRCGSHKESLGHTKRLWAESCVSSKSMADVLRTEHLNYPCVRLGFLAFFSSYPPSAFFLRFNRKTWRFFSKSSFRREKICGMYSV